MIVGPTGKNESYFDALHGGVTFGITHPNFVYLLWVHTWTCFNKKLGFWANKFGDL